MMSKQEAQYQVLQILAEARETGIPMLNACIAAAHFLDKHKFELPKNILDWLSDYEGFDSARVFH